MKSGFTDFEQQLFIASFYCYLNYDKTKDFIIDMDNVWKWLGFGQKVKAEKLLEKNFVIDIDYKNLAFLPGKASSNNIDFSEGKILPFIINLGNISLLLQFNHTVSFSIVFIYSNTYYYYCVI